MLILLIRIVFVIFACFFGYQSGLFFYEDQGTPPWIGAIIGFTAAVTLIAAEQAWRRYFNRTLIAFLFGLSLALFISYLLILILGTVVEGQVNKHLAIPITLIVTYLVLLSVLRNADRLRLILPFVELRNDHIESGSMIVDASALADSRLINLMKSAIVSQRIIIHSSVLINAEVTVRSTDDDAKRTLAKKALDAVKVLQDQLGDRITIDHTNIPNAADIQETLIGLARLESAMLCSNNSAMISSAKQQGLRCLVINELAQLLSPSIKPGENIDVHIDKKGENDDQGIGYLDDGSMVIVSGAADAIDQHITCTIVRLHQTNNGRMIFAERSGAA